MKRILSIILAMALMLSLCSVAVFAAESDLADEGNGEITVKVVDTFYFKCNSTAIVCKGDLTAGEWIARLNSCGGVSPADDAEGWYIVTIRGLYDFTERRYLRDDEYPDMDHLIDLKVRVATVNDDYIFRPKGSGSNNPVYVNGVWVGADVMDVYHNIGISLSETEQLFNISMSVPKPTVGAYPSNCVPTMNTAHVSIKEYQWYEEDPEHPEMYGNNIKSKFEDGKNYLLRIELEPDEGYAIPNPNFVEEIANITLNGKRCSYSNRFGITTRATCSFYVHYPITINAVNVNLTAPRAGALPDFNATKDNTDCDFYTGVGLFVTHSTGIEWQDKESGHMLEATEPFVAGKTYTATVWLNSKDMDDQITFADNVSVKLNGNQATIFRFSDIWIVATYDFVATAAGGCLMGDVTGDGKVDNTDAVTLKRYVMGWAGYASKIKVMAAADLDGSGSVNNTDAVILKRCVMDWSGYKAKYIVQK